ncbi:MAG: peptide chain release factor N(5)-glutamine methyltransferase [Burkholderiaceae bacterium]
MAIKPPADGLLPTTLADALRSAAALGLDRLDAQWLLLHALGRGAADRAWLVGHERDPLPAHQMPQLAQALRLFARRANGEPLAYLVGHQAFFGLDLMVDARVLIPRADTEVLVQWALDLLPGLPAPPAVLDLGTGSGAVALAIQKNYPQALVTALDASPDALAVAQTNAQRLGVPVAFLRSDWMDQVSAEFHLITANPPYIAEGDAHLAALCCEPAQALVAGADGLDDLRRIAQQAPAHLHTGGWLLLEHGFDQAAAVVSLLAQHGFTQVQSRRDLAGHQRCTGGQWRPLGSPVATVK